jgi:hypothetical protein
VDGERGGLLTRQRDAQHVGALAELVVVIVLVVLLARTDLLEDDDDAVELLVVGDADGPDDPLVLLGAVELEVLGQVPGTPELLDDATEVRPWRQ